MKTKKSTDKHKTDHREQKYASQHTPYTLQNKKEPQIDVLIFSVIIVTSCLLLYSLLFALDCAYTSHGDQFRANSGLSLDFLFLF